MIFSFNRIAAHSPMYRRDTKLVDKVEALDRDTVRFIFNTPYFGFFNSAIVNLVSKAYFERKGEAYAVAHPNGIGPYKFVDYVPAQYVDLTASDNYYGKQPEVRSARLYIVKDEQTRVEKLRAGEVDHDHGHPLPRDSRTEKGRAIASSAPSPGRFARSSSSSTTRIHHGMTAACG